MTKKKESRGKSDSDPRWLRARRHLLARYKRQARALEGPEPADLRAYRERHARALRGRWSLAKKTDLLASLANADIALGGDFHSLPQAQRAHLRVLRALPPGRSVTVGLECFAEDAQRALDRFARGEIDAQRLRRLSQWDRAWGFPWEGYAAIAELARARGWRLLALSPRRGKPGSRALKSRDQYAARAILAERAAHPERLVYAIFGELHLAPAHLPAALGRNQKVVSIHLNSERVYFALAERGLDASADVVRLGPSSFCLVATPPWVQWQAHWLHLQKSSEQGLDPQAEDGYDYTDHVAELVRVAAADLGVEAELAARGGVGSDISVYSSEDAGLWDWLDRRLPAALREEAAALVSEGRSFFMPKEGVFYLARATTNHASELAGQYVHAKLCGRKAPLWSMPEDFEAAIWRDAVGFFASKLMNPQRRGETLADARARLEALSPSDRGRDALLLALDRRMREMMAARGLLANDQARRSGPGFRPRRKSSWREAARILGAMMGERLYAALRSRSISLEGIVELLRMDVDGRGFARKGYPELVRRLGPSFEPRVPKKERL